MPAAADPGSADPADQEWHWREGWYYDDGSWVWWERDDYQKGLWWKWMSGHGWNRWRDQEADKFIKYSVVFNL